MSKTLIVLITLLSVNVQASEKSRAAAQARFEESALGKAAEYNPDEDDKVAPEELLQNICDYDTQMDMQQAVINRQKEIQKISGTIDLVAVHSASARLYDLKQLRLQATTQYHAATGKKEYSCE